MFIDALLQVDTAHAYTGAAVSENSIDLGDVTPKRNIAIGEEMGFGFFVDVAADCTTVKLEAIMDPQADLAGGVIVLAERTVLAADLAAGKSYFLPIPPIDLAAGALRYLGVRCTPAGGNATVTLTAALMPASLFAQKAKSYAKGYTIS